MKELSAKPLPILLTLRNTYLPSMFRYNLYIKWVFFFIIQFNMRRGCPDDPSIRCSVYLSVLIQNQRHG